MHIIYWPTDRTKGYADALPDRLFDKPSSARALVHMVRSHSGPHIYPAMFDLVVRIKVAILNYEPYALFNTREGWDLGALRLRFTDSTRRSIADVTWRRIGNTNFVPFRVKVDYEADDADSKYKVGEIWSSEGTKNLSKHLRTERNPALSLAKKSLTLQLTGKLACEACGFDFSAHYRDIPLPYAEVHHTCPVGTGGVRRTTLDDLAILCANCHRMIHKLHPMPTPTQFKRRCLTNTKVRSR